MSFRPSATSSRVLQVLLPLSLLLTALVPSTTGTSRRNFRKAAAESVDIELYAELRCMCLKTTSSVHPSNIQTLKVIRAGPHCSKVEVIAMLKSGKEVCLDPEVPRVKKMIQKILESDGSVA